jgi:hypothetical protein
VPRMGWRQHLVPPLSVPTGSPRFRRLRRGCRLGHGYPTSNEQVEMHGAT